MKKIIVILIVLGLLGAGGYLWLRGGASAKVQAAQPTTAKAERGPLRLTVNSTGRVVSNLDVDIKCKASGEVIALPFDISQQVKKGELLVELDPVDEQRFVKQAGAALASSQARLSIARQNQVLAEQTLATDRSRAQAAERSAKVKSEDSAAKAERVKLLLAKQLASQEDYDTAQTTALQSGVELEQARIKLEELKTQEQSLELRRQDVKLAEAAVETDTVSLDLAKQRLTDTKVVSPIDGVVTVRAVQIGQIISSAISNVGGGTTAMSLSDLSRMFVLASVDESDIGKVQLGLPVSITVDAHPDKRFRGEVVRIATRGVNASNVVTFEVKIEVLGENKQLLKPEMTANVEITAAERADVVLAPADSVSRKRGGVTQVTVVKAGGGNEDREVKTGISDGLRTEIVSGLEPGETVLVRKPDSESKWRQSTRMMGPMGPMGGGGGRPR